MIIATPLASPAGLVMVEKHAIPLLPLNMESVFSFFFREKWEKTTKFDGKTLLLDGFPGWG
jgi:hypothetical protein